jgi:hypothetical protein
VSHTHLGHELFKTFTIYRRSARLSEIIVDDNDVIGMPAERNGALPQRVLALGARVVCVLSSVHRKPSPQWRTGSLDWSTDC